MSVWMCGYDEFGQIIGTGSMNCDNCVVSPQQVQLVPKLPLIESRIRTYTTSDKKQLKFVDAVIGWSKIFLLDDNGQIYTSGSQMTSFEQRIDEVVGGNGLASFSCNWSSMCAISFDRSRCYQLDSNSSAVELSLLKTTTNERFNVIRCNDKNAFATTDENSLLYADLTLAAEQQSILFQRSLPNFCVRSVSCGKHHALILSLIGVVFSCGVGGQGQLGHGTVEPEENPRVIEALEGLTVTSVAAGGWHSMAVTDAGDLYVWGWNQHGQLGFPAEKIRSSATAVASDEQPSLSTGNCLSPTSTDNHEPRAENDVEPSCEFINLLTLPHVVNLPSRCSDVDVDHADEIDVSAVQVAAGSRHSVAVLHDGTVWTWGWNDYGQLGLGDCVARDKPTVVQVFIDKQLRVADVFAGWWNTVFITS